MSVERDAVTGRLEEGPIRDSSRQTSPHAPAGVAAPTRSLLVIGVAVALLAAAVRTTILVHSGGLASLVGYDQGVYYSAAEALAWGRLPYRDFLFLHPPGVIVALAPLGLVGRLTHDSWGIELARMATILVGAVNTALVAWAARRAGLVAATSAALVYAVWRPAAVIEIETRLEPFVSLGLLLALAVLASISQRPRRRWLVLAGVALGFALTVKIWAVVPVLVILAWFLARVGRRALLWVGGSLVVTTTMVCLPFFTQAPSTMFRMVVVDQVSRGRMASTSWRRLSGTLGLWSYVGRHPGFSGLLAVTLLAGAAALVLVWVRLPGLRVAVLLLLAQGGVLLASPSYFSFYDAYPAPALALCVGGTVAAVLGLVTSLRSVTSWWAPWFRRTGSAAVALACLLAVGTVARTDVVTVVGRAFPDVALRAAVTHARCVTADSVGALVALDVFGRDLHRGCRLVLDVGGLSHDRDAVPSADGRQAGKRTDLAWQRDVSASLESGNAQVLVRGSLDGFDRATLRRLGRPRVLIDAGAYDVYGTTSTGPGAADARDDDVSSTGPT